MVWFERTTDTAVPCLARQAKNGNAGTVNVLP
ncbi:hypothetical protein X759_30285 [Mesorhizobium sp. LSHC420B00]|nr:hypothetical protein X759_30285 [Mesorhizobium sp. LSHC420B00]